MLIRCDYCGKEEEYEKVIFITRAIDESEHDDVAMCEECGDKVEAYFNVKSQRPTK